MRLALLVVASLILGSCGLEATDRPPQDEPAAREAAAAVAPQQITPESAQVLDRFVREPEERPRLTAEPWAEYQGAAALSHAGSQTPQEVRSAHLAQIERMKCRDERVDYPPQFDDWHRLDLDGDGAYEYLVFLTLEGFGGGNNYSRYLIVYRYIEPVWFASHASLVGGKGSLAVSGATIRLRDRVLSVAALFPDEDDPTCCPSMDGEIAFDVEVGGLLRPRPVALSESGQTFHFLLANAAGCN